MATYRVAAVNEDKRPLIGVDIEAVSLNNYPTVTAVKTTGLNGTVQFVGITGPHWFTARVRRTSATVGGRVFTGVVEIQVVSSGGQASQCYDAVVDPDGMGTHTKIQAAVDAGATAAPGSWYIWICPGTYKESVTLPDQANPDNYLFHAMDVNWSSVNAVENLIQTVNWQPGVSGTPCIAEPTDQKHCFFRGIYFNNQITQNENLIDTLPRTARFDGCGFRQFDSISKFLRTLETLPPDFT